MKLIKDIEDQLCWIASVRPFRIITVSVGSYNYTYSSVILDFRLTPSTMKKHLFERVFSISMESRDVFEEIKSSFEKCNLDHKVLMYQENLSETPMYRKSFRIDGIRNLPVVLHVKPGKSGMKKFCGILRDLREKDILCVYRVVGMIHDNYIIR